MADQDRLQIQIDKIISQNEKLLIDSVHIKEQVGVIKDEVKKTNGRVTKHDGEIIALTQGLAVLAEDKRARDEQDKDKQMRVRNLMWAIGTSIVLAVLGYAGILNIEIPV